MKLRYGSVCSGIEAASVAWHPLGWSPEFLSEIEPFPSSVLAHHYPDAPNHGDMTRYKDWPDHAIDLLVGGTPCQSFSIAGLRQGLADPRGNLMLTYLAIARRYQPRWLVWENVPGVLSSNGGRDFAAFIGGLEECGYHAAWRVLDAQFVRVDGFGRAVPQRRRRVFVVGYLGDWRRAAAVLLERESLSGNPAPRRQAGEGLAADVVSSLTASGRGVERAGETRGQDPVVAVASTGDVAHCLYAGGMGRQDYETETMVATRSRSEFDVAGTMMSYAKSGGDSNRIDNAAAGYMLPVAYSIMPQNSGKDYKAREVEVAQPLMAGGPVGGNQGGDYLLQPMAFQPRFARNDRGGPSEIAYPLTAEAGRTGKGDSAQCVAFETSGYGANVGEIASTMQASFDRLSNQVYGVIQPNWAVRRLTPTECERLQGFPDGYTDVPYRNKPAADGPRYKALGNSMAVNCMRWIGRRIELIDAISEKELAILQARAAA